MINCKENKYLLFNIWVLKTLGLSNRKIAKAIRTDEKTIRLLSKRAYDYGSTFKFRSFAKDERVRIRYVGDTSSLERLNAFLHQNPCGGGIRKKRKTYDDNWEVNNGE